MQVAVSIGAVVLFWLIYPGTMALFASGVALCYLAAALAAARDLRVGVLIAFGFTVLAFAFSGYGVYRYLVNGFDYWSGNFPHLDGMYWPPYLFLLIALGSLAVIVLHALTWPWMLRPRLR